MDFFGARYTVKNTRCTNRKHELFYCRWYNLLTRARLIEACREATGSGGVAAPQPIRNSDLNGSHGGQSSQLTERCNGRLVFRKARPGEQLKMSDLIGYKEHSHWCEYESINSKLRRSGKIKLVDKKWTVINGEIRNGPAYVIHTDDTMMIDNEDPMMTDDEEANDDEETNDELQATAEADKSKEMRELNEVKVEDQTSAFSGAASKCVFKAKYKAKLDSESPSTGVELITIEPVSSKPDIECITIDD